MSHRTISGIALAAVLFALHPTVASATLLEGKTVEYQFLYPTITTLYANADNGNKLVGPGIEVSAIAETLGTMDISDANLLLDFAVNGSISSASFNGFRITDIFGAIPAFAGVTINPVTNLSGFDASRITFDDDHIWVNFQNLFVNPDTVVSLDISSVPEPTAISLAVIGLLGVTWLVQAGVTLILCVGFQPTGVCHQLWPVVEVSLRFCASVTLHFGSVSDSTVKFGRNSYRIAICVEPMLTVSGKTSEITFQPSAPVSESKNSLRTRYDSGPVGSLLNSSTLSAKG